jgi:ERCC4-type nuclease
MMEKRVVIIDTREQKPWFYGEGTERGTLKTGDYSIKGYEGSFAIERKSLPDLFGTLTKGHLRFKKELARGLEMDYFAIIVEGSWLDMIHKTFPGANHIKSRGDTVAKIITTIHLKYGIPIFFAQSKHEAGVIFNQLADAYLRNHKT